MKRKKSIYSITFDEKNPYWTKSRKQNVIFLLNMQRYANDLLRYEEHMFLNDVFKMLGFPKTKAGHLVGWIYDEENSSGDNYIDFNINMRGSNPNVVVDFNVDGDIAHTLWGIF